MKVFLLPEFLEKRYEGTLFAELKVVDDRNALSIDREPIPPKDRVMAFRSAANYAIWPKTKLDGTPDYRYNPLAAGGGDQWKPLYQLIECLLDAGRVGDILSNNRSSSVPLMATKHLFDGSLRESAVLTRFSGWVVPVYFHGEYKTFTNAIQRLLVLQEEIGRGVAKHEELYLDS